MKKFPHYVQHDSRDCGPTCLRMISRYYGKSISLRRLRELSFVTREGVSLLGISDAAEAIGMHSLSARISIDQLIHEVPLPCIAHWKKNHFVVIYKITQVKRGLFSKKAKETWFYVADPSRGLTKYNEIEFSKAWISTKENGEPKGHCLLLETTPDFYSEEEEENQDNNNIWYLLEYLKPHKKLVIQLFFGFAVSCIFSLIVPFLTKAVVDKGISNKDISLLTIILLSQFAIVLGSASVGFIRGWIMLHLSTRINVSLISIFLIKLMRMPISFFDSKVAGDLLQRIGDNNRIQNFITSTLINIVFALVNFIIFSLIIASYNIPILSIFILGSLIYILWIKFFLKYRRELDNRRFAEMSSNQSNIIELITGMQEIKMNNCEKKKRWEWEKIQSKLFRISSKGLMIGQYQNAGAVVINGIKNFLITYVAAKSVIEGQMTLGMMLSLQYMIGQLNGPIDSLIGFIQSWQDAKMSLERLNEIESEETELVSSDKINEIPTNKELTVSNLTFRYEGPQSPAVLDNINLIIPENKVTAIVGTSGSGKTTLLKLILGIYKPTEGQVVVGGTNLQSINPLVWRRHVATVMQDGFIFSDSIANNIALSDEEIDKGKLVKAAHIANIKDFIESLPLAYNTKIGNSGSGISQGQRQRILIARGVYKSPDFFLLDEATNALDSNNEKAIMNNFNTFFEGKTVIIVAHRLSTVKNAHKIVVIDKGKIVEEGNHVELVENRSYYHELVKNQLELGN